LQVFLISPMRVTCHLNFITLTIFGEAPHLIRIQIKRRACISVLLYLSDVCKRVWR
jgi:hypothetical protein